MSREFEVVVTDEMCEAAWDSDGTDYVGEHKRICSASIAIESALATPSFQRQLRAYVAEQMRGLVAKKTSPDSYHSNERARARVWNACRAETLANIEQWEEANENE